MSLTTEQHDILVKYLKGVGIGHQEPFEEFYDHIATAIEKDKPEDVSTYLREVIQPSFGGAKGIKKIVLNQRKARSKMIWKRMKEIFFSLFGWPAIGIVMVSFILVQTSFIQLGTKFTIVATLALGFLLPFIILAYGAISFHRDCKRNNRNYRNSDLNSSLMLLVHLPFSLMNIFGNLIVPVVIGRDVFKHFISENIWLSTFLCAFALLYGFTCLKLTKEQFIFKLEVA
ncbi:hypothetical protein EV198_0096 [Roseivirga ehrenbergii]|uniref:Uncharacterized protein n=1 Tax=Roseivirga ehrenbergii (strain DSM 102268 / JCM 13514 / KCTC 12282 / NCIMB 14502 / KMM 6017) TaxID=279360 RepID=A0A150WZX9_ROSEK|nr:hypothetical protein [Roseivirga ehrenbergii]KYG72051.1 hypothetical protein MB14_08325 [Roseivirga ehrenbergii]TCL13274.1 hypothetical protein EV198_0096 [Roseivirga ehrenbergii]